MQTMPESRHLEEKQRQKLQDVLEVLGKKPSRVSIELGFSSSYLGKILSGERNLTEDVIQKFSNVFNVSDKWWNSDTEMFLSEPPTKKLIVEEPQQPYLFGPRSVFSYIPEDLVKVPLLDINARAGFVENLDNYTEYLTVTVGLIRPALDILERYKEGAFLLPVPHIHHYNRQIQYIAQAAGFTEQVEIVKYVKGSPVAVMVPKHSTMTSHMARHTFGTISRVLGIDLSDLKDLMGHSDVRTTQIYDHMANEYKAQKQLNAWGNFEV